MIPESVIDQVQDRSNIVDIISQYVPLKRVGRSFKARCPFHGEKTPSFIVSPEKQIFHCFGCGVGGNVFSFLMKYEKMDFRDAVKRLAGRAGIDLPPDEFDSKAKAERSPLYAANRFACDFYGKCLKGQAPDSPVGCYIRKRCFSDEALSTFQIGFAPPQWDGLYQAARTHFSDEILLKAGLILPKSDGGFYDRFRNRLMFPIMNLKGDVLGFGARVLDDSLPKYINSPETEIYHKGRELYGLWAAKDAIRKGDGVIIVEGYTDVTACFQAGVLHAVSSSGTALTLDQVRLLKRLTRNVIVLFDADQAGEGAALRGMDLLVQEGCEVRLASLSKGDDPDSFIRTHGVHAFRTRVLEEAQGLFDYKLDSLKRKYHRTGTRDRADIACGMLTTIAKVPNEVLKASLIQDLARESGLPEEALLKEMAKGSKGLGFAPIAAGPMREKESPQMHPMQVAEKMLLGLMIVFPSCLRRGKSTMGPDDFMSDRARDVARLIFETDAKDPIGPAQVATRFRGQPEVTGEVMKAIREVEMIEDTDKAFKDCVNRMREAKRTKEIQSIQRLIRETENSGEKTRLPHLLKELHNKHKREM